VIPSRRHLGLYEMWFQRAIPESLGLVDLRDPEQSVPDDAAATIIMGSPVSAYGPHPWMPRAMEVARDLLDDEERPTLGVCFGHQLFCMARGGTVARNDRVEVGTVDVELTESAADDPLFGGFAGSLRVNASHDDTVAELPTPPPAVLGRSSRDRHQILRWGPRAWSVQFHPEMRRRETVLAVDWRVPRIEAEGGDPVAVRAAVEDAPDGLALLARFVELVRRGS
jgi:GMP synthase (glutamine-hydrolysing)